MKDIQTVFRICLACAVVGIVVAATLFSSGSTSPGILFLRGLSFFIVGGLPIVVYYVILSRRLAAHPAAVSESSIDSVYYLGFLITLTTLLASVISYGLVGFGNAKNASVTVIFIAMGFGLSLTATAFALWARVDLLQQREGKLASEDPDDVLNETLFELEEASRRLTGALRDASSRFEESLTVTNTALRQQVGDIVADTRTSLKEFVKEASAEVSASQRAMAEQSAACVQTMSDNNATMFAQLSAVIEQARTSLRDFVKEASLETSSSALAKAVTDVTASLVKASGELGQLFTSLDALQGRTAAVGGNLDALSASVRRAADSAAAMNDALAKASLGAVVPDLEPLHTGLAQLGDRLQRLGTVAANAEQRYTSASDSAVGVITARTAELEAATSRLSDAFVAVSDALATSSSRLADRLA